MTSVSADDLATIHPASPARFADGSVHEVMRRLRHEAPIHYTADSEFGAYWSLTRYKDIVEVEALPLRYSSEMERGGISLVDSDFVEPSTVEANRMEMFIAMDPPRHTEKRRVVAPAFTPSEMTRLAGSIPCSWTPSTRCESRPGCGMMPNSASISVPTSRAWTGPRPRSKRRSRRPSPLRE